MLDWTILKIMSLVYNVNCKIIFRNFVSDFMVTILKGLIKFLPGGQLRYQLYIWLEKEVQALRELCNYTSADITDTSDLEPSFEMDNVENRDKPTLHEILIQEKLDFEAKVHRATKRRRWLKGIITYFQNIEKF